jgi:hypothetical protein
MITKPALQKTLKGLIHTDEEERWSQTQETSDE